MYLSINDITFRCGRQLSARDSNRESSGQKPRFASATEEVFTRLALFSKKKDEGMLIRSKYRACVEWEYKSKRTLVTSFTFSVSILHKRYTALNHFYKGFCFRTIKMVTAHPTKGGHNAVCDTEALISFLPDQIFNENLHFLFHVPLHTVFSRKYFEVF